VDEDWKRPHQRIEEVSILLERFISPTSLKKGEINRLQQVSRRLPVIGSALCAACSGAVT